MPYEDLIVTEPQNGVQWIKMNRPKVKNAMSTNMYKELGDATLAANDNPAVAVIVFSGVGNYFSSGADFKDAMKNPAKVASDGWTGNQTARWFESVVRSPKVVVGAVNGPAVGAAVTLLPQCDLVYASDSATFWTPFKRIGFCPEFGSSTAMPRLMGRTLANEMFMAGRKLDVNEAKACGLVGDVFPDSKFDECVQQKIHSLVDHADASYAKSTLQAYKKLTRPQSEVEETVAQLRVEFICLYSRVKSGEAGVALNVMMQDMMAQKAKL